MMINSSVPWLQLCSPLHVLGWLHACCAGELTEPLTSLTQMINSTELVRAAIQGKLSKHT